LNIGGGVAASVGGLVCELFLVDSAASRVDCGCVTGDGGGCVVIAWGIVDGGEGEGGIEFGGV
jgi:hypothetical protein